MSSGCSVTERRLPRDIDAVSLSVSLIFAFLLYFFIAAAVTQTLWNICSTQLVFDQAHSSVRLFEPLNFLRICVESEVVNGAYVYDLVACLLMLAALPSLGGPFPKLIGGDDAQYEDNCAQDDLVAGDNERVARHGFCQMPSQRTSKHQNREQTIEMLLVSHMAFGIGNLGRAFFHQHHSHNSGRETARIIIKLYLAK